ncbi:MAG: hypothetical protein H0V95_10815 [Actinobacteria bacterium]|nr:hypothetical protein [Actinomycetota bacterium]
MKVKRSVACLAMAGSALAGGALFGPVLAVAQEEEPQGEERGPCRSGGHRGRHLEAAAAAIGIEQDALREALQNDQTIAQVAQANNVDPRTVVDALVADVSARIDEKVAAGDLTQAEADEKKAELHERMTALVNGEKPERPEGEGPPEGEQENEEPAETSAS